MVLRLKEMITSADDIGGKILESYEKLNSSIDFSRIVKNDQIKEAPYLWSL
jgi:hypothetical protein